MAFFADNNIDWHSMRKQFAERPSLQELLLLNGNEQVENELLRGVGGGGRVMKLALDKRRSERLALLAVEREMRPLSELKLSTGVSTTFKAYFEEKYAASTSDLTQPLVELDSLHLHAAFLSKSVNSVVSSSANSGKSRTPDKKSKSFRSLFIVEHVIVLPFRVDELVPYLMLPAVFHRANCLLKARKLRRLVARSIFADLAIQPTTTNDDDDDDDCDSERNSWHKSIKFHRQIGAKVSPKEEEEEEDDDDDDEEMPVDRVCLVGPTLPALPPASAPPSPPPTLIVSERRPTTSACAPNTYQLLQCLTLKSASDDFDLERYEILGDCYLKLAVVVKIYMQFFGTNEGKMAGLKSLRVSNRNLYRLALAKRLNEYIVSENVNGYGHSGSGSAASTLALIQPFGFAVPVIDADTASASPAALALASGQKLKLSDKSLADCVEALIGVYLITMGYAAADSFIKWLGFKISEKDAGVLDFDRSVAPPNPILVSCDVTSFLQTLALRYGRFETMLGYKFNNLTYLYQAFTHPSDMKNRYTSSYQK